MEYGNCIRKCTVLDEDLVIFSKTGEIITIEKPDECGTMENKSTTFTLLTNDNNTEKLILPYGLNLKIGKKIAIVYISNRKNIKQHLLIVDIEFGNVITISDSENVINSLVCHEESRHIFLEFIFSLLSRIFCILLLISCNLSMILFFISRLSSVSTNGRIFSLGALLFNINLNTMLSPLSKLNY